MLIYVGTLVNDTTREEGKIVVTPFKQKYDQWMREYKVWAGGFATRRKRRLISNI